MMSRKSLTLLVGALITAGVLAALYASVRAEPVEDLSAAWAASGHADRSSESFVHWDDDDPPMIPTACAKCHSTVGYLDFLGEDGTAVRAVDNEAQTGTTLYCNVCHNPSAHEMTSVIFPSEVEITDLGPEASCMQCHQGRESTDSVQKALADLPADEVSDKLGFINVHYLVGAATKMGSRVRGAYQYDGRAYDGFFEHAAGLRQCVDCHDAHSLRIEPQACSPCHFNVVDSGDLWDIRTTQVDYDGDGDTEEGVAAEIQTLHEALYAALQDYASSVIGTPILYSAGSFPYFFVDTDGDGKVDVKEQGFGNRYTAWTPRLVRTAYNYHYVHEDPGRFAHNPHYILQILYDSLVDLGQQVSVEMNGMTRAVP
jgi:hypothetical protein